MYDQTFHRRTALQRALLSPNHHDAANGTFNRHQQTLRKDTEEEDLVRGESMGVCPTHIGRREGLHGDTVKDCGMLRDATHPASTAWMDRVVSPPPPSSSTVLPAR
jgi:hypothetical protein